jgi:hypothetical protein
MVGAMNASKNIAQAIRTEPRTAKAAPTNPSLPTASRWRRYSPANPNAAVSPPSHQRTCAAAHWVVATLPANGGLGWRNSPIASARPETTSAAADRRYRVFGDTDLLAPTLELADALGILSSTISVVELSLSVVSVITDPVFGTLANGI